MITAMKWILFSVLAASGSLLVVAHSFFGVSGF